MIIDPRLQRIVAAQPYQRLRAELQAAHDASTLPELPSDETRNALNELLVRLRSDAIPHFVS